MTSTLSDRYLWAVLRAVPSDQRTDLEPEIRALVADAVEAQTAGGLTAEAAERAALTELGDPGVLASRYTGGPRYLIGPVVYPEWRRLVTLLVSILVPIIAIVVGSSSLLSGSTIGAAIVSAAGAAFGVALQTVFWITLVMAVVERTTGAGLTRQDLDTRCAPRRPRRRSDQRGRGRHDAGLRHPGPRRAPVGPVRAADRARCVPYPLFDPALWSFWLPWFIVVFVGEVVLSILLLLRGGWTYPFAAINAALGIAFAIPAVYMLQNRCCSTRRSFRRSATRPMARGSR